MPPPDADPGAPTHRLFNPRRQPVELYLTDQVVVVPPRGSAELALGAEPPPQVAELAGRGLVDVRPLEAPAPEAAEKPAPARPRRGGRRKKSEEG